MDALTYHKLKINVKSLASEAKFIRHEQQRLRSRKREGWEDVFHELEYHRRDHLRHEARAAQLLYAFVRGVPRSIVERESRKRGDELRDLWRIAKKKTERLHISQTEFIKWYEAKGLGVRAAGGPVSIAAP